MLTTHESTKQRGHAVSRTALNALLQSNAEQNDTKDIQFMLLKLLEHLPYRLWHLGFAVLTWKYDSTLQLGNKPAAHAAMLPGIAHAQQMLHHDRLQNAHSSREARHLPPATAGLCCAYRISGADVYSERSKDYWLDLMKAASLQGEADNTGLMMASSNLVKFAVNMARLLMGKSWGEYMQADKMLKEAHQASPQVLLDSLTCLWVCKSAHRVMNCQQ